MSYLFPGWAEKCLDSHDYGKTWAVVWPEDPRSHVLEASVCASLCEMSDHITT